MNDVLERLFFAEFPEAKKCNSFSAYNLAGVLGIVEKEFESFRTEKGVFFKTMICVERKSGVQDRVKVIVPEGMLTESFYQGKMISVVGQIRSSYNGIVLWGKLMLLCNENRKMKSFVCLRGEVKEKPYYIQTSKDRPRADIKLSVKGSFEKKFIIPCWARDEEARRLNRLWRNDTIELCGRIQSFQKNAPSGGLLERCRILIQHHDLVEVK